MTQTPLANLDARRILIGVSGGIAAYKILTLTSMLVKSKAQVEVILTRSALKLVTPASFQAFTGRPARTKMFVAPEEVRSNHIQLAQWAQVYLIAPATANTIGALACGLANNLLTCTALAVECPVVLAPAMNSVMWANPLVQGNVRRLVEAGYKTLGPDDGVLSCQTRGPGRMVEPEDLYAYLVQLLEGR